MQAGKTYFMVRAQVANESERGKFDQWYATHHLPLAMEKFHAEKGWRFWSRSDPSVHYALVADFDQAWPHITRTRDLIEAVQAA